MVYIFPFVRKKMTTLIQIIYLSSGQERKVLLENMLEAATEWSFNGFIENLKESMELEVFERIKHRIVGKNEIDSRLITMNRYFFGINTKC